MNNIILDVDSYKVGMYKQYPKGTQYVSSYIEARGSKDIDYDETVFFGMQYFLKEYLSNPITMDNILEAQEIYELHGEPFNLEGWLSILDNYDGYLPLKIESVLEGQVLKTGNVLVQVTNTDSEFFWLTTWIETALLRTIWYATSVASNSRTIKKLLTNYAIRSGSSLDGIEFKLHDFGSRGVSSKESAGIGGLAHLIPFRGTDNIEALIYGRNYYNIKMAGFSIPASEHSTMTTWKNEYDAMVNMLDAYPEYPIVACVADSYDIYKAVEFIGTKLKLKIQESGKTFVVRPDSGDPTIVPIEVIKKLMNYFGFYMNKDGYKTLPNYIRVIQGDGITKDSIKAIITQLQKHKLSLDNIAFGMGSGLLQQVNRDTYGFAMKASNIIINGKAHDVFKDPIHGGKPSKKGVLGLYHNENDGFVTERYIPSAKHNSLEVVYYNGKISGETTLDEIRQRAKLT